MSGNAPTTENDSSGSLVHSFQDIVETLLNRIPSDLTTASRATGIFLKELATNLALKEAAGNATVADPSLPQEFRAAVQTILETVRSGSRALSRALDVFLKELATNMALQVPFEPSLNDMDGGFSDVSGDRKQEVLDLIMALRLTGQTLLAEVPCLLLLHVSVSFG
jgi:hypothetical protein